MLAVQKIVKKVESHWQPLALFNEIFFEFKLLLKYNGSFKMRKDKMKLGARIKIGSHGIEKGLSFTSPKKNFGIEKIEFLLSNLLYYKEHFGDMDFIHEQIAPVQKYIEFNEDSRGKIDKIIALYERLMANNPLPEKNLSGILTIGKDEIIEAVNIDYEKFVKARHSYRAFSNEPVDLSTICKALEIAQMAPSACNRQPWKNYLFKDQPKNELLALQQGCNGFGEEIDKALLITVDYRHYFIHELHQAYVDGGLYAMCLIHALHSLGVGTIPLTVSGITREKKKVLKSRWSIPGSEIPILIIGVGNLKDIANVAASNRSNYKNSLQIIG